MEQHLSPEEIEAIVGGNHRDAFSVLGPHRDGDGVTVRAFRPEAAELEILLPAQRRIAMERRHDAGFFSAFVPNAEWSDRYRLRIVSYEGREWSEADPYAFPSTLSDYDAHLLAEGTHLRVYDKLGAHLIELQGTAGVLFAVWAPNAVRVSVVGNFNNWDGRRHPMRFHHGNGIWEIFVPGLFEGALYKYEIKTNYQGYTVIKSDPLAFASELRPKNASVVWDLEKYAWRDSEWLASRRGRHASDAAISVYEVHLGSWKLKNGWEWLTYSELAEELVAYVKAMGYTHIELLPVAEHPFDGSWGYQVTGYFAPTSRFGTPDEFRAFVDACHQAEIGVLLDWVPAHFPMDEHGLGFFDGTHLYEHADPRQGSHPDWGTYIFNYGRNEVQQFLLSNALFWLDQYHIDGLRVDAVASMLYLDFSRQRGEWIPNRYGGRENIEALEFIRKFNERVHERYPDVLTVAEESTSWPGVTKAVAEGGLGFDLKWNMGWMHDTLQYMSNDPVYRAYHQGTLTFSMLYSFSEHFLLPLSHDEVVHLKHSMLEKMPGDTWQRFANLRLLYGYQWTHPGKKLLFMGGEFGQWREWSEARSLDWHLLEQDEKHRGLQRYVSELNRIYRDHRALYEQETSWEGFSWIDFQDSPRSLLAYARHASGRQDSVVVVCNFTPVVRYNYRLGVPAAGTYHELLNSDATGYGGSGVVSDHRMASDEIPWHEQAFSIELTLPPLAIVILKRLEADGAGLLE